MYARTPSGLQVPPSIDSSIHPFIKNRQVVMDEEESSPWLAPPAAPAPASPLAQEQQEQEEQEEALEAAPAATASSGPLSLSHSHGSRQEEEQQDEAEEPPPTLESPPSPPLPAPTTADAAEAEPDAEHQPPSSSPSPAGAWSLSSSSGSSSASTAAGSDDSAPILTTDVQAPFHVKLPGQQDGHETLLLTLDTDAAALARAFAIEHAPLVGPEMEARLADGMRRWQLGMAREVIRELDRGARAAVRASFVIYMCKRGCC